MTDFPALIRRFEPVLYFHTDERFFPSDAKRYVENCALWRAQKYPFDDKKHWNRMIDRGDIAAEAGEGVQFIGNPPFSTIDLSKEFFLDLASWRGNRSDDAAGGSFNQYADLDRIAKRYTDKRDPVLSESRFWYHAEVFPPDRLRPLVNRDRPLSIFPGLLEDLKDPLLLCYYLFFPGHDEPLDGCGDLDYARLWGSCAGEWACVAIMLSGDGNHDNYQPTHIGLTSRNSGLIQYLAVEQRIGMRLAKWEAARKVGDHALVFVAPGTHGLYLGGGAQPAAQFSPDDYSAATCGQYETPDAKSADVSATDAQNDAVDRTWEYKVIGASAFLLNPFGGALVGIMLAMAEEGGMTGLAGIRDPEPDPAPAQFDHPPSAGEFGLIIHPSGVAPPDGDGVRQAAWPVFDPALDAGLATMIDHRRYSLWLATTANFTARPPWLPSDDFSKGFNARWGNRVVSDPYARRAGMWFPEFWAMFFGGLAKLLST
jgi:hypothetical protein